MKKQLFCITGCIPLGDFEPDVNIYQLINIQHKFAWSNLSKGSGLGFATDSNALFDTVEEAFISLNKLVLTDNDPCCTLNYYTIEEALNIAKEYREKLLT